MIGGNITALFQVKDEGKKNAIGEREHKWYDVSSSSSSGWFDLKDENGAKNTIFNAKIQESTHIFLCDYRSFKSLSAEWVWNTLNFVNGEINSEKLDKRVDVTSENARLLINNQVYQILLIDDPMGMHQHLEIYLKFVGGQNG